MKPVMGVLGVAVVGLLLGLAAQAEAILPPCLPDSVRSGTICMDKWEASVWFVPPRGDLAYLITWIKNGNVGSSTGGLLGGSGLNGAIPVSKGVVQLGLSLGDLASHGCPDTGNGCKDYYAVSIPGVQPARYITWFQAAAVARNSEKRLPTNQEWQAAALGTPDGVPCNVSSGSVANTGSAAGCVSDAGAFDMVGNLLESVADWVPRSTACGSWAPFSDDFQCLAGAATTGFPGALIRGGFFSNGSDAGVFAVDAISSPSNADPHVGFRAVR